MTPESLRQWLSSQGRADLEACHEGLMRFSALLLRHGRGTNLIGKLDESRIIAELLVDSLLPAVVAPAQGPVLDVGSGAGLPGIPLALLHPDVDVHLLEPRQKRVTFLRIATRELGLERVHIHRGRVEDFDGLELGGVGTVAAKAFRSPTSWLDEASRWVKPGGLVYLFLSSESWDGEAARRAEDLGFEEVGRADHPQRAQRFGLVLRRGG